MSKDAEYWDGFYKSTDVRLAIPSQFATFVASEYLGLVDSMVDVGCGNGRDALFFASLGFKVVGVDYSLSAVESARSRSRNKATFLQGDVSDENVPAAISALLTPEGKRLIYSRFFFHAISDEQELQLWKMVNSLTKPDDIFAIEFRTRRDEMLTKVTKEHYRRFVNPVDVINRSNQLGFKCVYFNEGFGYAKYKDDDAHVARLVLQKV